MRAIAKIDKDGFLILFRNGKWKEQFCPFQDNDKQCGNWCPLFRETTRRIENVGLERIPGRSPASAYMFGGIGYYLACQNPEKPFYLFSKITDQSGMWEINELGEVKKTEDFRDDK